MTHDNWFGGVYPATRNFFPQLFIDPDNQRQVYPELIVRVDEWSAFLRDRQGAIVGAATMQRFGRKFGDRIPIRTTIYGLQNKPFELIGADFYNFRSLRARWTSTIMAVLGIAGTVGVFVAMLSLARGFRATLIASGSPDDALVMRVGSTSEMMGGITLDSVKLVQDKPGVARDAS